MDFLYEGIKEAFKLMLAFDPDFVRIVLVSLKVSGTATLVSMLAGIPFGVMVGLKKFPGRQCVITILNTLMSLPTVVVGLLLYSIMCRQGPLGDMGMLFSLSAMIIGQAILAFPIISGLTVAAVTSIDSRAARTLNSLNAGPVRTFVCLINEARYAIFAATAAGFGRVFSEIGISMMLGGNIKGYTRNIPTAIALETSKGDFAMGFALGIVLLSVALAVNAAVAVYQRKK